MRLKGMWVNYHSGNCPLPDDMHVIEVVSNPLGQRLWMHVLKQEYDPLRSWTHGFLWTDSIEWRLATSEAIGLPPFTTVSLITSDLSGSLWGYIPFRAIFCYNNQITEMFNPGERGLPDELVIVLSFAGDRRGGLWVAMQPGGVLYYLPSSGHFAHVNNDLFEGHTVTSIRVDEIGSVWFAAQNQSETKFVVYDGKEFQVYAKAPIGDTTATVQTMLTSRNGDLWVCWGNLPSPSRVGLWIFNARTTRWATYTSRNSGLLNHEFRSIVEDRSGRVWVGTSIGFTIFDRKLSVPWNIIIPGVLQEPMYVADALEVNGKISDRPHTFIDSFAAMDEQGRIWVRSSNGLSVFADA